MTIKVLQLEPWMTYHLDPVMSGIIDCPLGSDRYPSIQPTFNRAGYYMHLGKCWIEVGGKAFSFPSTKPFTHRLKTLEAEKYSDKQIAALEAVSRERLATKSQLEALRFVNHSRSLKQIRRDTHKFISKIQKENNNAS